ncbi:hypothetical protein V6N13_120215 [Hibiscus sabdariffa]|uniref:Uncharacterized protein n=2 Tax=Hibiscus sabdariffa TaxID=183260 RepID=A0ABR2E3K8_9ROSI
MISWAEPDVEKAVIRNGLIMLVERGYCRPVALEPAELRGLPYQGLLSPTINKALISSRRVLNRGRPNPYPCERAESPSPRSNL